MNKGGYTTVLGVDPGTKITGYGIVKYDGCVIEVLDYGSIKPPQNRSLTDRYKLIFQAIEILLDRFSPDALVVETQYIDKNVQSGIKLGMARGVITLAASLRDIPVYECAPSQAKKAVVGKGRASKKQVQMMMMQLLKLSRPPEPQDAADALALAFHYLNALNSLWKRI